MSSDIRHLNDTSCAQNYDKNSTSTKDDIIMYVVLGISLCVFLISACIIIFIIIKMNECCRNGKKKKITPIPPSFDSVKYHDGINEYEQMVCAICLEAFVADCDVHKIHACGHLFHTACIEEYDKSRVISNLKKMCPLCKAVI